jgi:hypothetical protein
MSSLMEYRGQMTHSPPTPASTAYGPCQCNSRGRAREASCCGLEHKRLSTSDQQHQPPLSSHLVSLSIHQVGDIPARLFITPFSSSMRSSRCRRPGTRLLKEVSWSLLSVNSSNNASLPFPRCTWRLSLCQPKTATTMGELARLSCFR